MTHKVVSITLGLIACLAAGCTSLSVEERSAACTATDWHRFGLNDGRLGVPTSDRSDQFADCTELGKPADLAAYQSGRGEGLLVFCTAENGYKIGYEGRRYENVCPPAIEPDFLQGYERGRKDRPAYALYPSIGIGVGSGGVRTRVGIGIGLFSGCGYGGRHGHCYF